MDPKIQQLAKQAADIAGKLIKRSPEIFLQRREISKASFLVSSIELRKGLVLLI